jgi:uncharacterized protein YhdP
MAPQGGATQFTFGGREIEGGATWRGEGKGRLTARLKKFTLPPSEIKPPASTLPKPAPGRPLELPALDVIVEQFQHGEKQIGRLELNAVHQERDWRIEKLRLSNPDSVVSAEGIWQGNDDIKTLMLGGLVEFVHAPSSTAIMLRAGFKRSSFDVADDRSGPYFGINFYKKLGS